MRECISALVRESKEDFRRGRFRAGARERNRQMATSKRVEEIVGAVIALFKRADNVNGHHDTYAVASTLRTLIKPCGMALNLGLDVEMRDAVVALTHKGADMATVTWDADSYDGRRFWKVKRGAK